MIKIINNNNCRKIYLIILFSFVGFANSVNAAVSNRCSSALQSSNESIKAIQKVEYSPERAIQWRINQGDINNSLAQKALQTLQKIKPVLRQSLLGPGINTCYRHFGSRAVDTLHQLIGSLDGIRSTSEAYQVLVQKYSTLLKTDLANANRNICILAGAGPIGTPSCQIFSTSIAQTCK